MGVQVVNIKCLISSLYTHYFVYRFQESPESRKNLARQFVYNLMKKRWNNFGVCEELTIILFSKMDGVVSEINKT